MQLARLDFSSALKSCREVLAIKEFLARADPSDPKEQSELSLAYGQLGQTYGRAGQLQEACAALQAGRAIVARLVAIYPGSEQWQEDLIWFDRQIAVLVK